MLTLEAAGSVLLVVDFQSRLVPAIDRAGDAIANAGRLIEAARLLAVPMVFTEQNARGLGATVPELQAPGMVVVHKTTFDATRAAEFFTLLGERRHVVVTGCEAHVCVLQTVLGLVDAGRQVRVVGDAIGSRRPESKEAAIRRMERHGAEIVTTEMVLFEWLGSSDHPRFREVVGLVK